MGQSFTRGEQAQPAEVGDWRHAEKAVKLLVQGPLGQAGGPHQQGQRQRLAQIVTKVSTRERGCSAEAALSKRSRS